MTAAIASFIAYAFAVLSISIWAARKPQNSAEEIHLGGRTHGKWTSALSASASTESGFVLLGMVGMGYSVGANAFWIVPAGIFGYLLMWIVLGPKLRQKSIHYKAVTMPELIALTTGGGRTSRIAAVVASLLALIFLTAYVSAQFAAAGKAISTQFGLPFWSAVVIGASLVALYAAIGGFRAVSWTDNVQAAMMLLALVVLPIVVIGHIGGIDTMLSRLSAIDPSLTSLTGGAEGKDVVMAIIPWLMLGLAYPGQPHALARLMSTRDNRIFKSAAVIAVLWFILIYSGAVLLGMAARAGFSGLVEIASDPERVLPVLAIQFLPGIIAGMVVASILAAISSTADSTLLSATTTIVRDLRFSLRVAIADESEDAAFKKRFDPNENEDSIRQVNKPPAGSLRKKSPDSNYELTAMRIFIVVLSTLAVGLALSDQTGNVFGLVLYAWSGLGAALGPTVLYCALASRPRALPALYGLLVGGCAAFILHGYVLDLLVSFTASLSTILVSHLFLSSRHNRINSPVK